MTQMQAQLRFLSGAANNTTYDLMARRRVAQAALTKQEDVGESAWNGKAPTRQAIEPIMDGTEGGRVDLVISIPSAFLA